MPQPAASLAAPAGALDDARRAWPELSRLLDEALDLPSSDARAAWLAALPASPLKERLARLLAAGAPGFETADFLATLPRLSPAMLRGLADEAAPAGRGRPQPGDEVGPWRILRELGHGGMASVWLAERSDGTLKRQVALKLPHATWHAGLDERLRRERDILAALEHPHIARLYDAGVDALGRPWLALEHVQGRPIDEVVRARSPDVRARVGLVLQVAQAVAYAHSRLVIHRDLKPSNILVSEDGQGHAHVHLLDFGIAKLLQHERTEESELTRDAGRALTPDYASPEQLRGEPLTTASDVYSLAVVAYELLAGTRPWRADNAGAAALDQAIAAEPRLASEAAGTDAARRQLRGDLDAILHKALKKAPAERYATVDALAQDLARHLAGEKVAARPDSLAYRARRFAALQKWRLVAGAGVALAFGLALGAGATALVVAALAAGLAASLWQARRARAQAHEARQQAARAQAVQRFLLDVFSANTDRQPDAAKARQASARELLDRGAEKVETALAEAPEARAEVMATLAQMYYQLGHFEQAAAVQQRLVALLRALHGERDRRVAEALVGLANVRIHIVPGDQVLPHLREAQAALDMLGEDASPLRGWLLTNLAKCHYKVSTLAMLGHAEAAVHVLGTHAQANPIHLSTALQMAGVARSDLGDLRTAEHHLRRALAVLKALPSPPRVAFSQVSGSLGDCLAFQHRHLESLAEARESHEAALASLGPDDAHTHFLATRLGWRLHVTGRRAEGRALAQRALAAMEHSATPADPFFLPQTQRMVGRILLHEGAIEAARAQLRASMAIFRRQFAGTMALALALRELGLAEAAHGAFDAAADIFEEAAAAWRQGAGEATRNWRINRVLLDHARFEILAGRPQAAGVQLAQWVPWEPSALPPPPVASSARQEPPTAWPAEPIERDMLLTHVRLAAGDLTGALALAEATAAATEASPARDEWPALWADVQLQLARALLANGRAADARTPAQQAADWRRRNDASGSPWRHEAERVLEECLSAAGAPAPASP